MNLYCSAGHRVTYADTKPKLCPVCRCDMTPEVTVEAAAAPSKKGGWSWEQPENELPEIESEGQFEFQQPGDLGIRATGSRRPKNVTIGEINVQLNPDAADAGPVERVEREAPQGQKGAVTAAQLVQEMIARGA